MLNLLEKELRAHGVVPEEGGKFRVGKKILDYNEVLLVFLKKVKSNKTLILSLWIELKNLLDRSSIGESDAESRRLFVPALEHLYDLALQFETLEKMGVVSSLYSALCRDSNYFSSRVMKKVVEYRLAIEWTDHLILRNLYLEDLVKKHKTLSSSGLKLVARGIPGPWSNLDIPTDERVYSWDDIQEDLSGRMRDRQRSSRYTSGLEGYNNPRVREGFIWEEPRRFPYKFDDKDDNPYPHRDLLWKS